VANKAAGPAKGPTQLGKGRVLNFGGGGVKGPASTVSPKAGSAAAASPKVSQTQTASPKKPAAVPESVSADSVKKDTPDSKKKVVKQMSDQRRAKLLEEAKAATKNDKPHMNMVVIGHVDAGKSTTMGHLLALTGRVSRQVIEKYDCHYNFVVFHFTD